MRRAAVVFSGCDNEMMTVLDVNTGKLISTVPIGAGVDGNGFDPSTGFAFSANTEDGTLTVAKEASPGKWVVAETVTTQKGARTMTIDPKTHNIYLPTAEYGAADSPACRRTARQTFTLIYHQRQFRDSSCQQITEIIASAAATPTQWHDRGLRFSPSRLLVCQIRSRPRPKPFPTCCSGVRN